MKIGELAKQTGLSTSRIRFYERKGLLEQVPRGTNGYREYSENDQQILQIIICGQQVGFSLEEITQLLPTRANGWTHDKLIEGLHEKMQDLEAMEQRIRNNKRELKRLIAAVESKPEEISCEENAARVITQWNEKV